MFEQRVPCIGRSALHPTRDMQTLMCLKSGFVSGQPFRGDCCPELAKGCSSILMGDFAELYVDGQVKRGSVTSSQAI